jgi:hypothetical protein
MNHHEGCPQRAERVEKFTTTRPDGAVYRTTRCVDCAAHDVVQVSAGKGRPSDELRATSAGHVVESYAVAKHRREERQ